MVASGVIISVGVASSSIQRPATQRACPIHGLEQSSIADFAEGGSSHAGRVTHEDKRINKRLVVFRVRYLMGNQTDHALEPSLQLGHAKSPSSDRRSRRLVVVILTHQRLLAKAEPVR